MENFSHSRQLNTGFSKKSCNGGGSGSFAAPAKAIYDDVFGGPPRFGATTLSPRAEDYAEIFGSFRSSRATSIPVLDLPLLGEAEVYFDVRSSGFDYGEVFGGFDGADFAMSYEDLVRVDQSNGRYDSSDEAWTPEDAEYSSEELDHSAKEQCFSNLDIYESIDGGMEFNISCHKAGQRNSGDMSHLGKLPAVPGHTLVVDKISTLPKTDNDHTLLQASEGHRDIDFSGELKGVSKLRKTVSHPANGASKLFLGNEVGHDKRYARNGSLPTGMFVTISDVSLKTQPSQLPPPSRPPPPALDVQRGDYMKQIPGYKSVSTDWIVGDGSPPYFDVEVDASSSAAASAAAMKEAMEQAQAKLKSAKELMERKREGFSSHVKSSSKNARKGKEEKVTQIVDGHDSRRGDGYMGTYVGEEHGASGEWQKAKESQQLKKSIGQKKCPTMDRRPMEDAHGREALSSPGSDGIDEDEASEWKEATQFFELVRTSKSRKASDQENSRRLFMQNESIQEHENNENKEAMGALRQRQQNGRTVKEAGDADQLKEDEKKLQVPKGGCEQNDGSTKPEAVKVPHRQKGFECMVQVAQGISREKEKIFQMDPQLMKTEKKDTGSDWPQKHENVIEFQRQGGKIEVKQTTKQREKERLPRTDEREGSQREKEAFEQENVEKKLKAVAEENEIQQKEALEEEEIKKIKEACEQEEHTKKQKETREREKEKKLREALKREENERRIKEALEEEENERKLREIWEKEEEKKQKEAVEGEENEKRHRNTRECKENEKRLKDALEEVVDNERRLKESVKLDENAKGQREAREREENEKRLREATEREENEKKLKEFQERGEIEKILEEAFGNEEIQTEIKKACVTEETGKKTEGACGEANDTLKEGEKVEDIEVGKEAACLLGGMVDSSQEPCSLKEAKGKHLDDCDGEELKEFKKMGEDKGLLNQACKLDDGNNYGEVQLASTRVGKSEKQNDPEDTVFEETGKLPIKPKDRDDKAAVESENLLVDGRNEVSGLAQGSSENHKKDLPVQEVTESPCSEETANEEGKAVQNNEQESIHKVESVCHADCDIQGQRKFAPDRRGTESFTKQAQATLSEEDIMDNLKTSRGMKDSVETRRKEETPVPTTSAVTGNRHNIGQPVHVILSTETTVKDKTLSSDEKGDKRIKREQELEKERLRKIEEEIEREREREKDRMAIDRVTLEVRERAYAEARDRAERAAVDRAMNEARERLEKACAEAREKSIDYKTSAEARLRAERGAVERAAAEARVRAFEKAMADRAAFGARERIERSISDKFSTSTWNSGVRPSSSSDAQDLQSQWTSSSSSGSRYPYSSGYSGPYHGERREGVEVESAQRCKARLERHRRTAERAAKALAEKNMRDLLVQREQAERNRLAETLDADVKRWSSGKEGNLRALLSTLQYILGPDSGWQPIPLTEVITSAAVKKAYRKATLCVHPDKLQQRGASIQQKYICEKVFDLLKEAWNKFNSEER